MTNIIKDALTIIAVMKCEKTTVRAFLKKYGCFFENVDKHFLIPPECREYDHYAESAFVFVIGSYLHQRIEKEPVTWLQRRRFSEFSHYPKLFRRTVCSSPKRRFQTLCELEQYLKGIIQDENTN